jgi:hypothetical protein
LIRGRIRGEEIETGPSMVNTGQFWAPSLLPLFSTFCLSAPAQTLATIAQNTEWVALRVKIVCAQSALSFTDLSARYCA